ncbi:MAG: valine--tRNA ligase [Candidatus Vogelbacteria bacterium CG10_big_fil_rev_8_21_14_0_10_45_14]|uniref:Valine--tRNA ligase n=1 Tax=Candidatus Vogelbacteria bacterium CG10_big_fil_rev_8_21_14_0_10_45_14 TaxID=1975042 RepID=A0A2H0RKS5_9BACT|nr:MAG: valine--tRNA ligase [Candidatus Vogelbacteria bacterium CG10_big_fil_rev_8_21_14_0_10_45_14]
MRFTDPINFLSHNFIICLVCSKLVIYISMNEKLLQPYNPKEHEEDIYKRWEEEGWFNPEKCIEKGATKADALPFTIVLPPPNVTGVAHAGHAARVTTEDIMIRWKRMQGYRTLWIPGTDHAAIATQSKVEKILKKEENKSRHDLGREEFLKKVEAFAKESHDTIANQIRRLGASLDWSREAYTLDDKRNLGVRTAFKRMYDAGLIYRGHRIVNWDPKGQTVISDDEVVHIENEAKLYTFRYSHDFPIPIATTRPETKVGDTAVAVHPDDERYSEYVGKTYEVDFAGAKLSVKVIAEQSIDKDFGTGALGVTPAHSMTDWEMAERHGIKSVQVINEYAKMTDEAGGIVAGMKVLEAREKIVEWLKENNLLEKEETIANNLSTAERTGATIEPLPKLQWFIDVNKPFTIPHSEIEGIKSGEKTTLKEIMRKAVESGAIKFVPERYSVNYLNWVNNLRDWCISRQLWYGHRIPVWYKGEEIYVGVEAPTGDGWTQDEDTLDTWFSSALWTFSTLGWPEDTEDMRVYHPTDVLETAYEILTLWVSRMVMMAGFHLGTIPYHTVYIAGLVRDGQGRKFSKSLGNGVDPIETIENYGCDSLRMALIVGAPPGADMKLGDEKVKAYKKFSNKLWNIARFVMTETDDLNPHAPIVLSETDTSALSRLNEVIESTTAHLEKFNFHLASEELYHYVWHEFADKYIEESKERLRDDPTSQDSFAEHGVDNRKSAQHTLRAIMNTSLKLLHPFMPFVTEAIWNIMKKEGDKMLIVSSWPSPKE